MYLPWHGYLMAGLYILAGFMHFLYPRFYMRIMPPYLPAHRFLVLLSGALEIILAILFCLPATRSLAVYGFILMLLCYLPAHLYMLQDRRAASGLPKWLLVLRIPLQFALMYWAWSYL